MIRTIGGNKLFWGGASIVFLLLFYAVFSERGLLKVRRLSLERDTIKMRSSVIAEENRKLAKEAEALKHDIKAIERAARSQLDLVRKDEILYKFAD